MTDYDTIAHDYLSCWNDTEPDARRAHLGRAFSTDVTYTDPMATAVGLEQLDATIGAVQAQFPGHSFRLAGAVDGHGDQLRFTWELAPEGQEAPVVGFDVATLDSDGRIDRVLGFLDRVPA